MPAEQVEAISARTRELEENLSGRGRDADYLYAKFVLRQSDKKPPTQPRLAETMQLLSVSSEPEFSAPEQWRPRFLASNMSERKGLNYRRRQTVTATS